VAEPLTVSIPHRLGKAEAQRRFKDGLQRARTDLSRIIAVQHETWSGDSVDFQVTALGQSARGTIEFLDNELRLTVMLPWLLSKVAGAFIPQLRREATLLLEKK
jgi:hypothetical protein